MVGTICLSGGVLLKAGSEVSTDISGSETRINELINQAESYVSLATSYDWVTNWGTVSGSKYARVVVEAVSDIAAMYAIQYNMGNYYSRLAATTMLDVLRDRSELCIGLLKNKNQQDLIT